jgi:hypothetical protein
LLPQSRGAAESGRGRRAVAPLALPPGSASSQSSRPALTCIIGARRAWIVPMISSASIPCTRSWSRRMNARAAAGSAVAAPPPGRARPRERGGAGGCADVGTSTIKPTCVICRRRRASPRRVGARRLEIGITRVALIVLVGSVPEMNRRPAGGALMYPTAGWAVSKSPRSMPKPSGRRGRKAAADRLLRPDQPRELPHPSAASDGPGGRLVMPTAQAL